MGSILTEISGFFRARERNLKCEFGRMESKDGAPCGAYDVTCKSKNPFDTGKSLRVDALTSNNPNNITSLLTL